MSLAVAERAVEEPRVVHALPGRVRVRLPEWDGRRQRGVEARLRGLRGVLGARANPLTLNVLVRFDPAEADEESILAAARAPEPGEEVADEEFERESEAPPVQRERRGPGGGRARIAVRGIDRDPELARRVVERLERFPTVQASASQLTGRVLVEFDEHRVELEDLISEVAGLELPGLSGEERPAHPLDRERLAQSGVRTSGAAIGLGLLGARRLLGLTGPPVTAAGPTTTASAIAVLESFPVTKRALHRILGRNVADLMASTSGIVLHTIAGAPLNLAIAGAGALRVFTEARARRDAWRNYEERVATAPPSRPGAIIRLEPGERASLAAEVVEGTGTAVGRDGLPEPVLPGGEVGAGSKLYGGPLTLRLRGDEPFVPQERPEPKAESVRSRYARASSWLSLAFAAATAVYTRSLGRTLTALLLVSPRISEIGAQFADTSASARVLRAGVTVVGTRPDRKVRLPDVLLLDGARTLSEGLEVSSVVPQVELRCLGGPRARLGCRSRSRIAVG